MSAAPIILACFHFSAKNYQNWWKFDEVLTKQFCTAFLRHGVDCRLYHGHGLKVTK